LGLIRFVNPNNSFTASGSGFFISNNGIIATNAHVVKDAKTIEVSVLENEINKKYEAKVLLIDNDNDVALIKIEDILFTTNLKLPYKFNDKVAVGEKVFTLGFPKIQMMGENYKVTDGIISSNTGYNNDTKYFQISVPIQSGNSGGALFDKDGNIIGLTTAKIVTKGIENVGYAIKVAYLDLLVKNLPNYNSLVPDNSLIGKPLDEQVKILKNFICLIKVK
jgi:S1-C subfamily serine protease